MGKNLFLHHLLGQVKAVVGQAAQSQGSCVLDAGDHVQEQGLQQGDHPWKKAENMEGAPSMVEWRFCHCFVMLTYCKGLLGGGVIRNASDVGIL